ncbi:MAG: hypothetical protein AB7U29_16315 [Desulfobulbus sp.]
MKGKNILFGVLLALYIPLAVYLGQVLAQRPVAIKLGYTPSADVLKWVCGDQRYAVAEWNVLRVIFYFGSILEKWHHNIAIAPEYPNMFRTLETAVRLDPYNMDAYYFAQAAFTWDIGHARDVNRLLDYGMHYRRWDYYLPFFAGFNAAYFLHQPDEAARYFKKAAELSGNALLANLAARYFHEADQTQLAISFLEMMIAKAADKKEKDLYKTRLVALQATQDLQKGVDLFVRKYHHAPAKLQDLVITGILATIPVDPYGGSFYLDEKGRVQTNSHFAAPKNGRGPAAEGTTETP